MSHTPEPWQVRRYFDGRAELFSGDTRIVPSSIDMDRIVACVNACYEIPTEHLITGETIILHGCRYNELVIAKQQRDELQGEVIYLRKMVYTRDGVTAMLALRSMYAAQCQLTDDIIQQRNELRDKLDAAQEGCHNMEAEAVRVTKQRDDLLVEVLAMKKEWLDIYKQRDELLDALKTISSDAYKHSTLWASNVADEAIAKTQENKS